AGRAQAQVENAALVAAVQPRHTLQRDRVDVPEVAGDVADVDEIAVGGRVEAVIHARRQPKRDVRAIAVAIRELDVADERVERIARTFDLKELAVHDAAGRDDDAVAWTDEDAWRRVEGTSVRLQLADEAVVEADEARFPGLVQLEVAGADRPDAD